MLPQKRPQPGKDPGNRSRPKSHINPFHIVSLEVPAGAVTHVREQRVYTCLVFRLLESKLRFAVLKTDRIIAPDLYHSIRIAVPLDFVTN